ncbi:MAG TPA: winged helix-turn-helix domain-containing protein, partial [Thermoanaerobaculia bacterium]|nr:winged helix-turn-helix domain-containing protein [Thermoanaerobaculia bacterium]
MSGSRNDRIVYEFDGFRADPVRRRLSRGGEVVALTPKAFSILIALLEKRGQIVLKEDLIQQVWPDTFVTEANLTQNISSLRKALGERANDPRYVVTVPGQGYTFVGDVLELPRDGTGEMPAFVLPTTLPVTLPGVSGEPASTAESPGVPPPVSSPPPPSLEDTVTLVLPPPPLPSPPLLPEPPAAAGRASGGRGRRALVIALSLSLLSSLILGLYLSRSRLSGPAAAGSAGAADGGGHADRAAVAVLGFSNMSGNPEQEWLSTALSEMLATELGTGGRVRLISGENFTRARAALSLPEDAKLRAEALEKLHSLLGADLIVTGSYLALGERAAGKIRLDLQVIRVPSGEMVVALPEIGSESDLFDLVSRSSAGLRRALGWAEPSPVQAREAQALRPASPEAARLYAEGLTKLRAFDSLGARDLLARAAEADPKSAIIRSALAQAWSDLGYDARAAAEAEKAVQLSSSLAKQEQLAIKARYHEARREWSKAAEIYRSLWTFFPDDLEFGLRLANALVEAGRGLEAMDTVAALRKLPMPGQADPRIDLAEAKVARRVWDPDRALRAAQAAAAKGQKLGDSQSQVVAQALAFQGHSSQIMGRLDEASTFFRQAEALFAKSGNQAQVALMLASLGIVLDDRGELAESRQQFERALGIAQQLGNDHLVATQLVNLALLRAEEGDLAPALG